MTGRSVKGLCPFHNERTPSFHVQPEKGFFKCFGCGEAGDVITFLSKMEQAGFSETVEKLAERAGIRLKKSAPAERSEPEGQREKIFRLLEAAVSFYQEQLWEGKSGNAALRYLEERGVREETAEAFQLGFAPAMGLNAFEVLVKRGFPIELCQQAGLAVRSQGGRFYDPLMGRLIFPIFDNFGHAVGFGGRVLPVGKRTVLQSEASGEEGPKYLNSPETPVFSKGRLLYGLHQAKPNILASRRVLILEGYMDVIGVHQGGVNYAVATLGTALTLEHARLLRRYAEEAVAFFDADEAGRKAAHRGLEPLLQNGLFPRVVLSGETADPDEIIREKGREFLEKLVAEAPDFVDYLLQTSGVGKESSLQDRVRLAGELVGLIAKSPQEILSSEWTARTAQSLGLRRESLAGEFEKRRRSSGGVPEGRPARPPQTRALPQAEEEYLGLLLNKPELLSDAALCEADFAEARHKKLFRLLKEQWLKSGKLSLPTLADQMAAEEREWFLTMSTEEREFPEAAEREEDLAASVRRKRDKERLALLSQKLKSGAATADEFEEYKELNKRVKGSKTKEWVKT